MEFQRATPRIKGWDAGFLQVCTQASVFHDTTEKGLLPASGRFVPQFLENLDDIRQEREQCAFPILGAAGIHVDGRKLRFQIQPVPSEGSHFHAAQTRVRGEDIDAAAIPRRGRKERFQFIRLQGALRVLLGNLEGLHDPQRILGNHFVLYQPAKEAEKMAPVFVQGFRGQTFVAGVRDPPLEGCRRYITQVNPSAFAENLRGAGVAVCPVLESYIGGEADCEPFLEQFLEGRFGGFALLLGQGQTRKLVFLFLFQLTRPLLGHFLILGIQRQIIAPEVEVEPHPPFLGCFGAENSHREAVSLIMRCM